MLSHPNKKSSCWSKLSSVGGCTIDVVNCSNISHLVIFEKRETLWELGLIEEFLHEDIHFHTILVTVNHLIDFIDEYKIILNGAVLI